MRTRAFVLFWGSTVASVLLLGSIWSIKARVDSSRFGVEEFVLLTMAVIGFCVTFFAAARIAFVVGRMKKAGRIGPSTER